MIKRIVFSIFLVLCLASPGWTADGERVIQGLDITGAVQWGTGGTFETPYANTITVATSGGDYDDLSEAVAAATTNQTILVYPGTYTDTITFAADGVTVIGMGKSQNVILTQANANVVDFNTRSFTQMQNMTIRVTACNSDVDTITGSTGSFVAKFCNLQMTVLDTYDHVNLDQPAIVNVTGAGTFRQRIGRFTYTHPGDSAATGIKAAFKGADNSTIQLDHIYNGTITTSDGALAVAPVFDLLVTTTTEINNCTIDVTDSTAGGDEAVYVVGIGYVGGDAITHEYFNNTIHVTGGASSTGTFGIFAVAAATSTVATSFNHIHCAGAAANYGYSIGTGNTINSNFDDIMAASGNTGAGAINMVSSQENGDLLVSDDAFASTFDTNVAAAGVTLSGTTLAADGTDAHIDISITPKGTGEVNLTKVDIDAGAIDGTAIGGSTPAAVAATTLSSSGNTTLGDAAADSLTVNATVAADLDMGGNYFTQSQSVADLASGGTSLWFDGVDDVVTVGDDANLDFGTGDFSIITSISSTIIAASKIVFAKQSAGSGYSFGLTSSGVVELYNRAGNDVAYGITSVLDGANHIIGTVRDGATGTIYVDGMVDTASSADMSTDVSSAGDSAVIGYRDYTTDRYFDGQISRTLLFNLALNSTWVKAFSSGASVPFKWNGDGGSPASQTEATSGTLVLGKAYRINNWITDDDFVNVGGANVDGTEFVAAGAGCAGLVCTPTKWAASSTVVRIGCVLNLSPEGISPTTWTDASGNDLDGTISGAKATNMPVVKSVMGEAGAPGVLNLLTAETTVILNDEIGRINFGAPLEASGTDAILYGAGIWAVAGDTFAAGVNDTDLVFATGLSAVASEKARITGAGLVQVGTASGTANVNITPATAIDALFIKTQEAAGATDGIKITDSGDAEIFAVDSDGNVEATSFTADHMVVSTKTDSHVVTSADFG